MLLPFREIEIKRPLVLHSYNPSLSNHDYPSLSSYDYPDFPRSPNGCARRERDRERIPNIRRRPHLRVVDIIPNSWEGKNNDWINPCGSCEIKITWSHWPYYWQNRSKYLRVPMEGLSAVLIMDYAKRSNNMQPRRWALRKQTAL